MASRRIRVQVELPDEIGEDTRAQVEASAHEAVVLSLWQSGKLTNREAALELGLSYYDFLDFLAARGLPVVSGGEINAQAIDAASRKLGSGSQ